MVCDNCYRNYNHLGRMSRSLSCYFAEDIGDLGTAVVDTAAVDIAAVGTAVENLLHSFGKIACAYPLVVIHKLH